MQPPRQPAPLLIGLVAGEASGDQLGAGLIEALRARLPHARFVGVAGPQMRAAGCEALGDSSELAVMGLVEPLRHLPRLLRLRARLERSLRERRVNLFVGIDSPAFNLGLARRLRDAGIPTAQYVSPQVWAWRRGRVKSIARAVHQVLCLLPFEPAAYAGEPVDARFVGHPLAQRIDLHPARDAARQRLGITAQGSVVAVLPGSRDGEIQRLGADFAAATVALQADRAAPVQFISPAVSAHARGLFEAQIRGTGARIRIFDGQADDVLAAADAALVASGTATLQTMLHAVPMVVAYRLAPLTAFIARDLGLVKLRHFSLPNLLAGEELVPEFLQEKATPSALAAALAQALDDQPRRERLQARFRELHRQLREGGSARVAETLLELLARHGIVAPGSAGT